MIIDIARDYLTLGASSENTQKMFPRRYQPCIDIDIQVHWNVRVEPSDFGRKFTVGVESIVELVGIKAVLKKRDSPF